MEKGNEHKLLVNRDSNHFFIAYLFLLENRLKVQGEGI